MLRIELLGNINIWVQDEDITKEFSAKGLALLALLATSTSQKGERRVKLIDFLWPDCTAEKAKYNMRHTLWSMKKIFSKWQIDSFIMTSKDRQYLNLNKQVTYQVDTDEFNVYVGEIERGDVSHCEELSYLYRASFLNDLSLKDCMRFDDWLIYQRENYDRKFYESLFQVSELEATTGNLQKSVGYLEKILRINPLEEDIYRKLIELNILMDNKVEALKYFERCRESLRNELNLSPSMETVGLIEAMDNQSLNKLVRYNKIPKGEYVFPYAGLSAFIKDLFEKEESLFENLDVHVRLALGAICPEYVDVSLYPETFYTEKVFDLRLFKALSYLLDHSLTSYHEETLNYKDDKYDAFWAYYRIFKSE